MSFHDDLSAILAAEQLQTDSAPIEQLARSHRTFITVATEFTAAKPRQRQRLIAQLDEADLQSGAALDELEIPFGREWEEQCRWPRLGADLSTDGQSIQVMPGWHVKQDRLLAQLELRSDAVLRRANALRRLADQSMEAPPAQPIPEVLFDEENLAIKAIAQDRTKSSDDRMRAICRITNRFRNWTAPQWGELLRVRSAAIRQNLCWKELRELDGIDD